MCKNPPKDIKENVYFVPPLSHSPPQPFRSPGYMYPEPPSNSTPEPLSVPPLGTVLVLEVYSHRRPQGDSGVPGLRVVRSDRGDPEEEGRPIQFTPLRAPILGRVPGSGPGTGGSSCYSFLVSTPTPD